MVGPRRRRPGLPAVSYLESWLRIAVLAFLAVLGLPSSLKRWPLLMQAIFLASFFPVGLYLPGVPAAEGQPGVFRLIGVANLLYLIARLWLFASWLRAFPGSGTG
jgi:hypothetical protein